MGGSGTCNVCSAPCTSCMHVNRVVSSLKSEGSSDTIYVNKGSQHSSESGIVNPVPRRSFYQQDLVSLSSSHESVSENIENIGMDEESCRKDRKEKIDAELSNQGIALGVSPSSSLVCANLESSELLPVSQSNGGNSLVDGSEVLVKPFVKIGVKTERNISYLPDESSDCSNASKGTLNGSVDLSEVQEEPSLQCQSGDESQEVVEHDVNICDICGDAGREDLLATCSGCSDGAEHTYCMQEKMEKVPEGDWSCEECRLAEKMRKQRDMVEVVSKIQPYSRPRSLQRNHSLKMVSGELQNERNRENNCMLGTRSRKRQLEMFDSSTAFKRQATEEAEDLPVGSSSRKLSRNGSSKNVHDKAKDSLQQPSHRSLTVRDRTQTHKGPLLKSNSFSIVNPKSRDKCMDDMHNKQRGLREPGDAKEVANRLLSRSLSLRPVHLGRVNAVEPKVKMVSPTSSCCPYPKGFKKLKEPLSLEKRKAFRVERTLGTSSPVAPAFESDQKGRSIEDGLISSDFSNKTLRVAQINGKVITSTKVIASHRASDIACGTEKKLNKPNAKVESSSGTRTAVFKEELTSPRETLNQVEKNVDNTLTCVRTSSIISGSNLCHRCKEPSTAAHVCLISSPRLSVVDPPAVKVSLDDTDKGNQLKAAIQAALLRRPGICKKTKLPEHGEFDEEPVSTSNTNSELAVQGLGTNSVKNTYLAEKKYVVVSAPQNLSFASSLETSINHVKQPVLLSTENVSSGGRISTIGDRKPNMKSLPTHQPLGPLFTAPMSAIPVHEYIWQGDFEVNRNGAKVPDIRHGFQAHLSNLASPKVFDVVPKFSSKLSLTEIPRLTAWPTQFHDGGVTEDNIALYFFAKDVESYERNYKNLLDNMTTNDTALKGNIGGVELLIFSSSQLPQKSQRWNMLFFMWGVFLAKKATCQDQIVGLSRKPLSPEKSCIIASGTPSCVSMPLSPIAATKSEQQDCNSAGHSFSSLYSSGESSPKRSSSSREEHYMCTDRKVEQKRSLFAPVTATAIEPLADNKCLPVHVDSAMDGCGVSDIQNLDCFGLKGTNTFGYVRNEKEPSAVRMVSEGDSSLNKDPFMIDISTKELPNEQLNDMKRSHIDLMESFSPVSASDVSGMLPSATTDPADNRSKKLKASNEENDIVGISASKFKDVGPSVTGKKILYDLNLDASDLFGEFGTTERYLSSIECPQSINLNSGGNSTRWDLNSSASDCLVDGYSKDQDQGVPVLNLALGTDTASSILRKDDVIAKKEAASPASLSLSLAFPLMDEKQKSSKAAARTEELNHGPLQVKPPFLLFGGLADK